MPTSVSPICAAARGYCVPSADKAAIARALDKINEQIARADFSADNDNWAWMLIRKTELLAPNGSLAFTIIDPMVAPNGALSHHVSALCQWATLANRQKKEALVTARFAPLFEKGEVLSQNTQGFRLFSKALRGTSANDDDYQRKISDLVKPCGLLSNLTAAQEEYMHLLLVRGDQSAIAGHFGSFVRTQICSSRFIQDNTFNALCVMDEKLRAAKHYYGLVRKGGVFEHDPDAHMFFARFLLKNRWHRRAARFLSSRIKEGGILHGTLDALMGCAVSLVGEGSANKASVLLAPAVAAGGELAQAPLAHNTYARARINAGKPEMASDHLLALTQPGGLLADDAFAFYNLCRSYHTRGRRNDAFNTAFRYIKNGQPQDKKRLIMGASLILAFFDENDPLSVKLLGIIEKTCGKAAMTVAKKNAQTWNTDFGAVTPIRRTPAPAKAAARPTAQLKAPAAPLPAYVIDET